MGRSSFAARRYDVCRNDQTPAGHPARTHDSHYACVLIAAKRARQINAYYHNLGEGTFDEYPPPMVETGSKNYLKIALEEIAADKLAYRYRVTPPSGAVARILLGVSGGIAAYKAVELVRLATKARPLRARPPDARRAAVRGRGHVRGDHGRPGPERRVRARSPPAAPTPASRRLDHDPISHLELVRRCDAYVIAPASANTIAKLAAGLADNLLTSAALALHVAARHRARDEQRDVRAPRHPGQPRQKLRERGAS